MDEFENEQYNQSFGCAGNSTMQGEFHESIAIHSQALCQVPYRSAQGSCIHHLRKS
jgi:hypothetical protein